MKPFDTISDVKTTKHPARQRRHPSSADFPSSISRFGFHLLAGLLLAAGQPRSLAALEVPPGDLAKIQQAAPSAAPAKPARPRQLLVFTLAKGFVHEATPWGVAALRIVGEKTGAYTIVASDEPDVFERTSLARFDAVCFLNTCYTPFTNAVLQTNLMEFVRGGKGYVGIHCSAHTFLDWPEFGQLQGAYSVSHPWHEKVTVAIEEPEHPLMQCFGGTSFSISDEIYLFDQRYSRQRLRVLASLDTRRSDMTKPGITRDDRDFGLVWIQPFGQGRAFYSAFGHDQPVFWDPTVLRHYLAGIQFAFGDLAADTTPSAQLPRKAPPPGAATATDAPANLWAELKQYEFTGSRSVLVKVEGLVRESLADAARQRELEQRFIALLGAPDTTAPAKEFLCWQLRLVGSASSVPAVAKLLTNEKLSHAARMALQGNPAPAAGQALREALPAVSGRLLIGIINSIAVRRDPQAAAAFRKLAGHDDPGVAAAAVAGLGQIGGAEAVEALGALWTETRTVQSRRGIADAWLQCADRLLADGQENEALAIYRRIFDDPHSPSAARLAAAVGLLTQQKQEAVDTVVQFLGGADSALRDVAIRHLRLLPGDAVTRKLSAPLGRLPVAVQVQLLHALAERRDPAATATLIQAAASEHDAVRLAALAGLARQEGTPESVARLLDTAASRAGAEQAAARDSLIRLRGPKTDQALLAQMGSGTAARRVETIQAVGRRGLTEGSAALLHAAHDPALAVRIASIKALGQVAGSADYPALIDLLTQVGDSQEREEAARALEAVALRVASPEQRVQPLAARLPQASVEATTALLRILAALGGPTALTAVQAAARREDAAIQNAAIRALADWPDASAVDVLRSLIPSTTNATHRTLALRGFIRLIGQPGVRPLQQTVMDYRQALGWATTLDEKKLILSGLAELRHAEALALAEECSRDPALQAEAALATEKIRKALGQKTGAKP